MISSRDVVRRAVSSNRLGAYLLSERRRAARVRRMQVYLENGFILLERAEGILADFREVCLHTLLTPAGIANLEFVIDSVNTRAVPGAFVECGTWRGGAVGYFVRANRRHASGIDRHAWAFDSFEGFPELSVKDEGERSQALLGETQWGVPESDCREIILSSGISPERAHVIKGWFSDTLPSRVKEIGPIAILRLDGDLYESTKTCLDELFDSVVPGGAVIIDDYGVYPGAKRAWDEFNEARGLGIVLSYGDCGVRYFFKR